MRPTHPLRDHRRATGRRLVVLAVLLGHLLAACASQGSPSATDAEEAQRVPDLALTSFDGREVSLVDHAGTPMVVNMWASWCPPCIAEMPDFEAVHQQAGDRVRFVGINVQDAPEAAADLVEQTGVTYDLLRDPEAELSRAFGVIGMPSTFYVDEGGRIVGRHTGLLTRDALVDDLRDVFGVGLP